MDYLKGKHIALFVAALLLLLFISLPYTVALLFIQCLQYRSRYRILSWIRRLKPLLDAYTGPYKDKHRYWPGLLLVVRVVLFLVFSVNVFGDPAVSLLTIIVTTFCILYFSITFGGVYKNIVLTLIEYSFFLNLSDTIHYTDRRRPNHYCVHICGHCFHHFHGHYLLPYTGEGDQGTAETEVDRMGNCKTENN